MPGSSSTFACHKAGSLFAHAARAGQNASSLMHHLIYLSQATVPFEAPQLEQLLAQARAFNAAHELTGILLYGNDQFFQVLEGEAGAVRRLYERIGQDPRHRNVTTYADKAIAARAFPDWHMAYQALPPQEFLEFAGYVAPSSLQLERPGLSIADAQLLQLLRTFVLPEGN
ncbi:MAG: BLUF domain-containing protein [Hymenobacter sp.]|nr:MAG: BLUF domain-containing protein [Hymenobacter sp.]